jgi:hypothetical protein
LLMTSKIVFITTPVGLLQQTAGLQAVGEITQ